MAPDSFPLTRLHRSVFAWCAGLGLFAIAAGAGGLLREQLQLSWAPEGSPTEHGLAVLVGLLLVPFGVSGFRLPGLRIDAEELRFIGMGLPCRERGIALRSITRVGIGTERQRSGEYHVLLVQTADERTRSLRISMYRDWRRAVDLLLERTGLELVPTRRGWTGAQWDEEAS